MGKLLLWLALIGAAGFPFVPGIAKANGLEVSPISLKLNEKTPSAMIALTNRSDQPVRFHVTAMAWSQKPDGEMVFAPTQDIVFFPAMLTLNPQEGRNLRIGAKIKPGSIEKTYRVFVQELPKLITVNAGESAVGMLTKMAIPVFVEPAGPKPAPSIAGLSIKGPVVKFSVKNTGNVHIRPEEVSLKAKDGSKVVHKEDLHAWYVLAGGVREYVVTLPIPVCMQVKSLEVEMKSDQGPARSTLGNVHCTP